MSTLTILDSNPMVFKQNNQPLTTSKIIADYFGKEHKNVLRDIQNLECSEQFSRLNFEPSEYTHSRGKTYPTFNITEAGFMFLAMGFKGKKAALLKEAFITEFQRMALLLQQQQLDAKDQTLIKHIELLGQKDQEISNLKKRLPRRWTPEESKVAIECYFELGQRIRVIADRMDRTYNSTKCFIRRVRKAMEAA